MWEIRWHFAWYGVVSKRARNGFKMYRRFSLSNMSKKRYDYAIKKIKLLNYLMKEILTINVTTYLLGMFFMNNIKKMWIKYYPINPYLVLLQISVNLIGWKLVVEMFYNSNLSSCFPIASLPRI